MLPWHSSFPSLALWTLQDFSVPAAVYKLCLPGMLWSSFSFKKKRLSWIFLNIASQSLRSTQIQITKRRIQLECFEIQFSRKAVRVYSLFSAISKIYIYLTSDSLQNFSLVSTLYKVVLPLENRAVNYSHKYAVTGQSPWVDTYHWNTICGIWFCCRCCMTLKINVPKWVSHGRLWWYWCALETRDCWKHTWNNGYKDSCNHLWKVKHELARIDCFIR